MRPGSVSTGIDPMHRGLASLEGPLSLLSQRCRRENPILPSPPLYHSFRAPAVSLSLIHIITPNEDTTLALNSPDLYDSNGATYMCLHAWYKEIRKLPEFCLHVWGKLDRRERLRIIYR